LRFLLISNTAFFLITHLRIGYPLFWLMELRVDDALSRPWTLVTYSFLHANTFHLLINMLMLWMFGDEVAQHLGTRKFIAFYLIAALVAGLASLPFYGGVVVGASGALFGVMYLYAALFPDRVMLLFWIIPMRMSWGWGGSLGPFGRFFSGDCRGENPSSQPDQLERSLSSLAMETPGETELSRRCCGARNRGRYRFPTAKNLRTGARELDLV
jgi:hypothetical protein